MRLLLVCDHFPTYGTKSVLTLAEALVKRKHEVVVASTSSGLSGEKLYNDSQWPFKVIRVPSIHIPRIPYSYIPFAGKFLADIAREFQPDVVHSQFLMYWLSLNSAKLSSMDYPLVLSLHGLTLPGELSNAPSSIALKLLYYALGEKLVNSSSRIICVSTEVQSKFKKAFPTCSTPTKILPIGISPKSLETSARITRREIRNDLNLNGKKVFIFLGRVVPEKGVIELVRAFHHLRKNRSDIALLIVGDGEALPYLKNLTKRTPDVHFTGFRGDIGTYLRAADIFVLPSSREGFTTSLIEAMFFGLSFIATRVGGLSDLLDMGAKGVALDRGTTIDVYNAMMSMVGTKPDELREMGSINKNLAMKYLTWDHILNGLMPIYDEAVQERRSI